jgi:hypothetical protein
VDSLNGRDGAELNLNQVEGLMSLAIFLHMLEAKGDEDLAIEVRLHDGQPN